MRVQDEDVYKRDVTAPTLEDHFDKLVLPKVMQVKNFGRAGRTKYTHLADQDTSVRFPPNPSLYCADAYTHAYSPSATTRLVPDRLDVNAYHAMQHRPTRRGLQRSAPSMRASKPGVLEPSRLVNCSELGKRGHIV